MEASDPRELDDFLRGKSNVTQELFWHLVKEFQAIDESLSLIPAKTMIGIATSRRRIAYVTRLGKNFVHVVFIFDRAFEDNLCFQKVGQVPGQKQFNHHFRMLLKEDVNEEVKKFMCLACELGS